MVSEKPPRRSRKAKEPVTIDLSAEETNAVAEPIRSNDTDEPVTPAEDESLRDTEATAAADGKGEDLKEDGMEASSEPSSAEETIREDEAEEADTRAGFAAPPQPAPASRARSIAASIRARPMPRPRRSGTT